MKKKILNPLCAPHEVQFVWACQFSRYVGLDTLKRCNATIEKYPEYFPWETTYNSLPKEVHKAYKDELTPGWDDPIDWDKEIPAGKGITQVIGYAPTTSELSWKDMQDWFESMHKRDIERREEEKRREAIWHKHYKKYKLEYRHPNWPLSYPLFR